MSPLRIWLVGSMTARVQPEVVLLDDPLASVDGIANAVVCQAGPLGQISITGPGAGPQLAGQGVLERPHLGHTTAGKKLTDLTRAPWRALAPVTQQLDATHILLSHHGPPDCRPRAKIARLSALQNDPCVARDSA